MILSKAPAHGPARRINVRVEMVARAPAYRAVFRTKRCMVLVDGFYEWCHDERVKQPFFVRREDHKLFALAGIWDRAVTEEGEVIESCAVLHDRSARRGGDPPRSNAPGSFRLRATTAGSTRAQAASAELLVPDADGLIAYPVSSLVNSPANDDPRCIEPAEPAGNLSLF